MTDFYIGFIKEIDLDKKIGILKTKYYLRELKFEINKEYENLKKGDIVGYFWDEWDDTVSDIKLAKNYIDDFRSQWKKYGKYEWSLILIGIPELYKEELKKELDGKEFILKYIDRHIETIDIDKIIENYKVEINISGNHRPGEDDSIFVSFVSRGHPKDFYWDLYEKYKHDDYLARLLPEISKEIYKDRAFTYWKRMADWYKSDIDNWKKLEKQALIMEDEIKKEANRIYNKEKHKIELKTYLEKEVNEIIGKINSDITKNLVTWGYWAHSDFIEKFDTLFG